MLVAGLITIVFAVVFIILLVSSADLIPRSILRMFGYFLIVASTIELAILIWIFVYIWRSDWTLWELSFNAFWREQLAAIYFIKRWLYSWLWNDLLNFFFEFLPAVVFLTVRTTVTTVLGFWALSASKS